MYTRDSKLNYRPNSIITKTALSKRVYFLLLSTAFKSIFTISIKDYCSIEYKVRTKAFISQSTVFL